MSQILFFSDLHIHPFSQFSTGDGKYNSRVLKTLEVVDQIREYAKHFGITTVVCGGDVFHSRISQRYEYFNQTYKTFRRFKQDGIDLTIIMGNHDMVTKDGSVTTVDSFQDIATIVRHPSALQTNHQSVWLIPYTSDFGQAVDWLNAQDKSRIILHHLDIIGCDTGLGYVSEIGIGRDNFERFRLSLGGHYHKRQEVLKNCWYLGCCCPQNFTERDQPGHFCVLDDETAEVQTFTTLAPIFREMDPDQQQVLVTGSDYIHGAYVRIKADPHPLYDQEMEKRGALAWSYAPEKKKSEVLQREQGISVGTSAEQLVETYSKVHAGELSIDEVIKTGLELLQE